MYQDDQINPNYRIKYAAIEAAAEQRRRLREVKRRVNEKKAAQAQANARKNNALQVSRDMKNFFGKLNNKSVAGSN